jgi:hypothetical protein
VSGPAMPVTYPPKLTFATVVVRHASRYTFESLFIDICAALSPQIRID